MSLWKQKATEQTCSVNSQKYIKKASGRAGFPKGQYSPYLPFSPIIFIQLFSITSDLTMEQIPQGTPKAYPIRIWQRGERIPECRVEGIRRFDRTKFSERPQYVIDISVPSKGEIYDTTTKTRRPAEVGERGIIAKWCDTDYSPRNSILFSLITATTGECHFEQNQVLDLSVIIGKTCVGYFGESKGKNMSNDKTLIWFERTPTATDTAKATAHPAPAPTPIPPAPTPIETPKAPQPIPVPPTPTPAPKAETPKKVKTEKVSAPTPNVLKVKKVTDDKFAIEDNDANREFLKANNISVEEDQYRMILYVPAKAIDTFTAKGYKQIETKTLYQKATQRAPCCS